MFVVLLRLSVPVAWGGLGDNEKSKVGCGSLSVCVALERKMTKQKLVLVSFYGGKKRSESLVLLDCVSVQGVGGCKGDQAKDIFGEYQVLPAVVRTILRG